MIPHKFSRIQGKLFDFRCKEILNSLPLNSVSLPYQVVSQLARRDLIRYLIALKSLVHHLGPPASVHVINDGTLKQPDFVTLRQHIPSIDFDEVSNIDTGPCPKGATWERLIYIIKRSSASYVIQVDSDTLTVADIGEVKNCILNNHSFTLGTYNGQQIESVINTRDRVMRSASQHVQVAAEKAMDNLDIPGLLYVRGSSGFAGFAQGAFTQDALTNFSLSMEKLIGRKKWTEWGSEQVASNHLIANAPNPLILPKPKYANHVPEEDISNASFIHFIGTHRYENGNYLQFAHHVINRLSKVTS